MGEEYWKKRIDSLIKQIEELEKTPIPTQKRGYVTRLSFDSDLGMRVPDGKELGWVSMSNEEIMAQEKAKESKLSSLKYDLKYAQEQLFRIEWDKPENVAKRVEEAKIEDEQQQEKRLGEERAEHEKQYEDLNKLITYLRYAGMRDLAEDLSIMRFAKRGKKDKYVQDEIEMISKEKSFRRKTVTTKKELKEIKKYVENLTRVATKMAKKYKDLNTLYRRAWEIIDDIEQKGITKYNSGDELVAAMKKYFTEPTGRYYGRKYGNNYELRESENLGYEYLAFYRDSWSKYREDKRNHKI